jgi:uncharacterized membrane protein YfcA
VLNVLVATITSLQFRRAGQFSWALFWPFALLAVPLAFLGGSLDLPTRAFRILVGLVLLASAANLLLRPPPDVEGQRPSSATALLVGGGIGLFAGLTGTGGGIFPTPLLLLRGWERAKAAAAVSALLRLLAAVLVIAGAKLGAEPVGRC